MVITDVVRVMQALSISDFPPKSESQRRESETQELEELEAQGGLASLITDIC